MNHDRTFRSLIALEKSASTARVLNLLSTHRKLEPDADLKAKPFFRNPALNHAIIVKHRVRPNELELFAEPRAATTKIMVPIDTSDLRCGARFLLMGERDFDRSAEAAFGDSMQPGQSDRQVLDLLDQLPSLDPFLTREHLKRNGFEPARGYFAITDADVQRMNAFVRAEVMALVTLSAGQGGGGQAASRLTEKLLSSAPDSGFEPLRDTLHLKDKDYQDGVFCWRGFLYYKWVLAELAPRISRVMAEVQQVQPRGPRSAETSAYLPGARGRLSETIARTVASVDKMLDVYNCAYNSLTLEGQPMAFRDFLLAAPDMFMALGEQCGAVQHIVSFWRFRFQRGCATPVSPEELMDILLDFEDSLAFLDEPEASLDVA